MMKKTMTTHELAELLFLTENKPVYLAEHYEHMGESSSGYSNIIGLDDSIVENGYVLDKDFLKAEPNDKKYIKGDAFIYLNEEEKQLTLSVNYDDITYMIFEKKCIYHSYNIENIGFYIDESEKETRLLKPMIKVSLTSGFHPKWKEMSLEEAKQWYEENFEEYCENYNANN